MFSVRPPYQRSIDPISAPEAGTAATSQGPTEKTENNPPAASALPSAQQAGKSQDTEMEIRRRAFSRKPQRQLFRATKTVEQFIPDPDAGRIGKQVAGNRRGQANRELKPEISGQSNDGLGESPGLLPINSAKEMQFEKVQQGAGPRGVPEMGGRNQEEVGDWRLQNRSTALLIFPGMSKKIGREGRINPAPQCVVQLEKDSTSRVTGLPVIDFGRVKAVVSFCFPALLEQKPPGLVQPGRRYQHIEIRSRAAFRSGKKIFRLSHSLQRQPGNCRSVKNPAERRECLIKKHPPDRRVPQEVLPRRVDLHAQFVHPVREQRADTMVSHRFNGGRIRKNHLDGGSISFCSGRQEPVVFPKPKGPDFTHGSAR